MKRVRWRKGRRVSTEEFGERFEEFGVGGGISEGCSVHCWMGTAVTGLNGELEDFFPVSGWYG